MNRIKVDPAQLAQAAQELAEAAERLQRLADEAHAVGSSAPSYDSQFGPKVERLGLEALSALGSQSQRVGLHGDELLEISQAFAEADQQAILGFEQLVAQFGGLLEGLGQLIPGALSVGDQPVPVLQQSPPPPGLQADDEDEKTWLDRFADQIADPEFFFDLITSSHVAEWMSKLKNAPPVTIVLPMLKGFGMDDISGPLVRTVDSSFWIRTVGRVIGDASVPPLYAVGWALSVGPEQYQNIRSGAPWNEFAADLAIDSSIYGASEVAGWAAGASVTFFGGGPQLGLPAKLVADPVTGALLEWGVDTFRVREWLAAEIKEAPAGVSLWFDSAIGESIRVEIPPIPTPPEFQSSMQTPVPSSTLIQTLQPSSVPATGTPVPPSAVEEVPIMVTPPPGETPDQ